MRDNVHNLNIPVGAVRQRAPRGLINHIVRVSTATHNPLYKLLLLNIANLYTLRTTEGFIFHWECWVCIGFRPSVPSLLGDRPLSHRSPMYRLHLLMINHSAYQVDNGLYDSAHKPQSRDVNRFSRIVNSIKISCHFAFFMSIFKLFRLKMEVFFLLDLKSRLKYQVFETKNPLGSFLQMVTANWDYIINVTSNKTYSEL